MLLARRMLRLGTAAAAASRKLRCISVVAASEPQPRRRHLPSMHQRTATPPSSTSPTLRRQHLRPQPFSSTSVARATKQPSSSSEGEEEEIFEEDLDEDDIDLGDEDGEETPADEEVDDGGTPWGKAALAVARGVLNDDQLDSELSLWSFKAHAASKRIEIRLDKLSDRYGSPSLDDVALFSRRVAVGLAETLGEEAAGEIEVEASSAGAARRLRLPRDLLRFAEMPLAVSPKAGSAAAEAIPKPHPAPLRVISVVESEGGGEANGEGGKVTFATADVRVTRGNRGRLTKKQLEARFEVSLSDLEKVTLYVDV